MGELLLAHGGDVLFCWLLGLDCFNRGPHISSHLRKAKEMDDMSGPFSCPGKGFGLGIDYTAVTWGLSGLGLEWALDLDVSLFRCV